MKRLPLPVDAAVPEVVAALARAGTCLLRSPTGSGKTTRVPPALVRQGAGEVVVLEPRRLAARAAARRVAHEHGSRLGGFCGYQVRHDKKVSSDTRVRFVTEGILVRQLEGDPFLEGVDTVVLDEFHERHLEGDLAIAMLKEVRETVRPELRIVVMSATLDPTPLLEFLPGAEVVDAEGRAFPVETTWLGTDGQRPLERRVVDAVRQACAETEGDVLTFLPGVGEIHAATRALEGLARERDLLVAPLHGRLDGDAQYLALQQQDRRRVVLATNVAESSVTVPGVTAVIDSGLARVARHDPGRGLDTLRLESISLASAEQRKGRAGRTAPGWCYRMWSRPDERRMRAEDEPEVHRVDLAGAVLQVRSFAGRAAAEFDWFEPPRAQGLDRAEGLLRWLGAVDDHGVTATGRAMLTLPLPPRLARMVIEGRERGCARAAATAAALVAEVDPRRIGEHRDLVDWTGAFLAGDRAGVDGRTASAVRRVVDATTGRRGDDAFEHDELSHCVLSGFADRVAQPAGAGEQTATMVGGRGLRLPEPSTGDLFVAVSLLDVERGGRAQVSLLCAIDEAQLPASGLREQQDVELRDSGKVVLVRRRCFGDLVLSEHRGGKVAPDLAAELLGPIVARDPWRWLGDGAEVRRFLARAGWLRERRPDLEIPSFEDDGVAQAVAQALQGETDLSRLKPGKVVVALMGLLPPNAVVLLSREVSERVALPSGRNAPIDYAAPAGPTVQARIQELFSCVRTPTVGGEPVVLEILAPNQRPVQVTRDLAGFWERHYPALRRELGRRYPKHAWPEDPTTASPDRRGPRRRRS